MKLERKLGFYEKYIKRLLDIICSILFIVLFWWLFAIIAIIVRLNMGKPIFFRQPRPGIVKNNKETIFYMFKFRSMTDERDSEGRLLPDNQRLSRFGVILRSTSLDELPEIFSILKGDMSVVGPRPQLIRDMVFMSEQQRLRHTAKPGLTGLAQVKGRNSITWDEKLDWDIKYIENVSFWGDVKILFQTIYEVFKRSGINDGENATALDYGDRLLAEQRVTREEYDALQNYAKELIREHDEQSTKRKKSSCNAKLSC